jgi:four helix bundle protein
MIYNLENRTGKFGKELIEFLKATKITIFNENIIKQLIKSATSVGANYCEANGAASKKDFRNKIFYCKKEIKETKYWIEMLAAADDNTKNRLRYFWKEAHELILIFNKISQTLR